MSQSDNALYQALVARLETLTGEDVDIAGASNNRLLQYMLLLMNQLELGDGSGGGGSGPPGKSAYELAQDEGFTGTLEEWLESLVGPPGQDGEDGEDGQDGTGGGGPSDASYTPSNKPRLSAIGTADYLPPNIVADNAYGRYFGPRFTVTAARSYQRLEVPLRDIVGGEELAIIALRQEAGAWIARYRQDTVLTPGQVLQTFEGPFEMGAGETWAVVTGFNSGPETQATMNKFYGNTASNYPAPFPNTTLYKSDVSSAAVGENGAFTPSSTQFRTIRFIGSNVPKGVAGKADPPDITFSGTTAQRPAGMPTGFQYFDTLLSRPVWFDGSGWRDASGTAV